eukprot:TRINITY_DN3159_c0_g1_i1.p1 TRINITY_DN3159_c0_g1~~TRINITY_DN3159_c0_g1_i1.p1  ORF type:complete len:454 (+),score=6.78 TRINITY_DN3159_c0_g1_i1:39-1400(+)
MAPPLDNTVKLLELCRISPPPGSVAETSLPLTFFDVLWLTIPIKRLFFYEFPHPKPHFLDTLLPKLKHSLSLTLQLFYPLAGTLTHSSESNKPEIRYTDGDSVALTVAESDTTNFHKFIQNHPLDVTLLHPLVPQLSISDTADAPVLAVQVTVFPNFGICIGVWYDHAAADGRSFAHFMTSWASICRSGDTCLIQQLPLYDRTVIPDNGLLAKEIERIKENRGAIGVHPMNRTQEPMVRAVFVVCRADLENIRSWVLTRRVGNRRALSSFVLTCAYLWASFAKMNKQRGTVGNERAHFLFPADCRARLDSPVPETYFGNCVKPCFAEARASDLAGDDGVIIASEALDEAIGRLGNGVLNGVDRWITEIRELMVSERFVSVGGSAKFQVYGTDFGWGRPRKVELIVNKPAGGYLVESREGNGGVEIALTLPKTEMDDFDLIFVNGLDALKPNSK